MSNWINNWLSLFCFLTSRGRESFDCTVPAAQRTNNSTSWLDVYIWATQ